MTMAMMSQVITCPSMSSRIHSRSVSWSQGELPPVLTIMYYLNMWLMHAAGGQSGGIDVLTANDKELRIELKRRLSERMHTQLMGTSQADPVRYASSGFKARHYNKRFGAELGKSCCHQELFHEKFFTSIVHSILLEIARASRVTVIQWHSSESEKLFTDFTSLSQFFCTTLTSRRVRCLPCSHAHYACRNPTTADSDPARACRQYRLKWS